ncbi:STAS domain-containing protein [Pseudidiomarina taiwanensis]|uniref:Anti-sigma B factor antagonist n=1 Tax=Pseudidiomarina taiwanensis TaxID=337250 RepID=A0A432ZKU0_9GAMM|nr:STAS domain-containing protein [Pseudidiomarina taiwanensis]RUO78559.1 anti-sigma B factor antagonist [Pseudidiomarina taiwanensis]
MPSSWKRVNSSQIAFTGELNRDTVPTLWQDCQHWLEGEGDLAIELAQVQLVDSAGVAMLLQLQRRLQQHQRQLILLNPNAQLRAIVELSGVSDLVQFEQTKTEQNSES